MRTTRHTTTTAAAGAMLLGSVLLAAPAAAQDDENCSDSTSQAAAQAHLRADPSDPDQLDGNDGDGLACETFDYDDPARDEVPVDRSGAAPSEPPVTGNGGEGEGEGEAESGGEESSRMVMPEGGVATGGGGTAGPENTGLLAAGGIAFTIGAGGLIVAARRNRA